MKEMKSYEQQMFKFATHLSHDLTFKCSNSLKITKEQKSCSSSPCMKKIQ